jgi:hypothetical protein
MGDNRNQIIVNNWSNPASQSLYMSGWTNAPLYKEKYENGQQCGGCSFYAEFNADWGLCAHEKSPHYLETVFEHFTCPEMVNEGWGPHGFTTFPEFHCRCGGAGSEYWDEIVKVLRRDQNNQE